MSKLTRRTILSALAAAPVTFAISARAATNHAVEIKGFGFSPASLKVAAGDTITFTNRDAAPHTATAKGGAFDTGTLKKGQSASVTVSKKGKINYFCRIHPRMKATLSVN